MHCSDLERYLEAHLDGRLGRNRSAILQRHLVACSNCRERVEELRGFEQDLHGKFRTMRATAALWESLQVSLVSTASVKPPVQNPEPTFAHPAPIPAPNLAEAAAKFERNGSSLANQDIPENESNSTGSSTTRWWTAAACALFVGAAGILTLQYFDTNRIFASFSSVEPTTGVDIRTSDAFILRNWLGNQLGYHLPQIPTPDGFELVGGSVVDREVGSAAVIAYDSEHGPAMLHVRRNTQGLSFAELASTYKARGMTAMIWSSTRFEFALFSGPDVRGLDGFRQ